MTVYMMAVDARGGAAENGDLVGMPSQLENLQKHVLDNPEILQMMIDSDAMQALLENPDLLRQLFDKSPTVKELTKFHPEFGKMLYKDPDFMAQMQEAMQSPGPLRDGIERADKSVHSAFPDESSNFALLQELAVNIRKREEAAAREEEAEVPLPSASQSEQPDASASGEAAGSQVGTDTAGTEVQEGGPTTPEFKPPPAWAGTFDCNAMVAMVQDPSMQQLLSQLCQTMGPKNKRPNPEHPFLDPEFYAKVFQSQRMASMVTLQQAMNLLAPADDKKVVPKHAERKRGKNEKGKGEGEGEQELQPDYAAKISGLSPESPAANFTHTFSIIMAAQQENPEILYKGQITAMRNMGFTDDENSIRLLHKYDGNMSKAIDALMAEHQAAAA